MKILTPRPPTSEEIRRRHPEWSIYRILRYLRRAKLREARIREALRKGGWDR